MGSKKSGSTNPPRGLAVVNPDRARCSAHKKTGEQCKNPPVLGAAVCRYHGAGAPAVRQKAMERLVMASLPAVKRLIEFTDDEQVPYSVRLAAARDLLDRGGLGAAQVIKFGVGEAPSPWEALLADVMTDDVLQRVSDNTISGVVLDDDDEDYNATAVVEENPSSDDEPTGHLALREPVGPSPLRPRARGRRIADVNVPPKYLREALKDDGLDWREGSGGRGSGSAFG